MLNIMIIVLALLLAAYLAFSPRLKGSERWRATVTPLASIMGSGFLVVAPLLGMTVGHFALLCMALLLLLAYATGDAIRFNIRHFEPIENASGPAQHISFVSRIVLAGAYFISVTYYLKLLAAFLLKAFGIQDDLWADVITTLILLMIGSIGMWRGLTELEKIETYAVSLNLGMIGGLLIALAIYNVQLLAGGQWQLPDLNSDISLTDLRVLLGLLIVVQGFETSRYLQAEHSAAVRIATMRSAQRISSVIYLLFIALVSVLFQPQMSADVTGITVMVLPVAAVLPLLISVAAIGSQFSAAVADTSGAGGLVQDIERHRLPLRYTYLMIMVITILLTWETHVNVIIAWASRAFALFYTLQAVVAFIVVLQKPELPQRRKKMAAFALTALLCALVFAFGLPSE
ncbi:MAG: hypothetical protein KYX62_04190 [Pseudomonadota bacterium]|nr:hypothetical protein [Pseudomonadota bacterium]